jgi:putative N-acetylmannosamine-6-phosphate epimerase
MSATFTQAQEEALAVIQQLLSQNFDAAAIIVLAEGQNNAAQETIRHFTVGSSARCLGIAHLLPHLVASRYTTVPAQPNEPA